MKTCTPDEETARIESILAAATPETRLLAEHAIRNGHTLEWFLDAEGEAARAASAAEWTLAREIAERREAYWRRHFRQSSIWLTLAAAGVDDVADVTWELLRKFEKTPGNFWGKHKSELVASTLGLPPRPAKPPSREEKLETALQELIQYVEALVANGVCTSSAELAQAKDALRN